jgi:ATP-dependent exoDNAse (exonuclease V) beta subunit
MTEVTITNITNNHEGRIDALLEYPNGYGLLDWKSYDLSKNISGREKWQLTSNALLANYRYSGKEDDWTNNFVLYVIMA